MASTVESENFLTASLTVFKAQLPSAAAALWVLVSHNTTYPPKHFRFACLAQSFASVLLRIQMKSCRKALDNWRMQVRFLCFQKLFRVPPASYLHWKRLSSAFNLRNRPHARAQELLKYSWTNPGLMQVLACLQHSIHRHKLPVTTRM